MAGEMTTSWAMLMALGAFHGINPGMGWLFAVALGMQERRRGAVLRALVPLGAGHALAVAGAIAVALAIGAVIPIGWLRWPLAGVLVSLGVLRCFRHRHPRWAGHAHYVAATEAGAGTALLATGLHAMGYLAVTASVAVLVFEKLGVGILRRAWINLDVIWAAALMATGTLTLAL